MNDERVCCVRKRGCKLEIGIRSRFRQIALGRSNKAVAVIRAVHREASLDG
jgi:hypothetical protein